MLTVNSDNSTNNIVVLLFVYLCVERFFFVPGILSWHHRLLTATMNTYTSGQEEAARMPD